MSTTAYPIRRSILVVEDEPAIRHAVSRALSNDGYSVRAANDVPSAAEELDREAFAAILTDLRLPGPSGISLVDEVQCRRLATPVILMSGSFGDLDGTDVRIDRLAGLLAKPFHLETLRSLVRAVIGKRP